MFQLKEKRPVFHSEADFQHALAWEMHSIWTECSMRLEYNPTFIPEKIYLDIFAFDNERALAIELKYKTRKISKSVGGESFDLSDQSAQDIARYDFVKDIVRLEQVVSNHESCKGYAIFLTNDRGYWRSPTRTNTVDAYFRINEGRTLKGVLEWSSATSLGTMRGREERLQLSGSYPLRWYDYSTLNSSTQGRFRYLLVEV